MAEEDAVEVEDDEVEMEEGTATGSTAFSQVSFTVELVDGSSRRMGSGFCITTLSSLRGDATSWSGIKSVPAATVKGLCTGPSLSMTLAGLCNTCTPFRGTGFDRDSIGGSSLLLSVESRSGSDDVG